MSFANGQTGIHIVVNVRAHIVLAGCRCIISMNIHCADIAFCSFVSSFARDHHEQTMPARLLIAPLRSPRRVSTHKNYHDDNERGEQFLEKSCSPFIRVEPSFHLC